MKSDDYPLIQSILSGNRETYAILIRTHQARVLKLCLMLLANSSEAEDAAQDIFVKAYEALPSFRGGASFSTWVCRIAHNHCLDILRKKTRHKTDSLEGYLENHEEPAELTSRNHDDSKADGNTDPLLKTLSTLRPDHKEILLLREVGGLHYEEIASNLGCSLDAVKSRLRRARQELQEKARHFFGSQVV